MDTSHCNAHTEMCLYVDVLKGVSMYFCSSDSVISQKLSAKQLTRAIFCQTILEGYAGEQYLLVHKEKQLEALKLLFSKWKRTTLHMASM